MLEHVSRTRVAGSWVAAIVVLMACSVAAGLPLTQNAVELWLAAAIVPPVVILLMWQPTPPESVAELLHSVDSPPAESRR
jgi:hypothetical protein